MSRVIINNSVVDMSLCYEITEISNDYIYAIYEIKFLNGKDIIIRYTYSNEEFEIIKKAYQEEYKNFDWNYFHTKLPIYEHRDKLVKYWTGIEKIDLPTFNL